MEALNEQDAISSGEPQGKQFYVHDGLDKKLLELFTKDRGFYVEVGAGDGITDSPTLLLENHGWQGILIESNIERCAHCKINRPKAAVLNCECIAFESISEQKEKGAFPLKKVHQRPIKGISRTLNSILNEFQVTEIDLLVLNSDKGHGLDFLEGLDLFRYRPEYLLVGKSFHGKIHPIMKDNNYELVEEFPSNQYLQKALYRSEKVTKQASPLNPQQLFSSKKVDVKQGQNKQDDCLVANKTLSKMESHRTTNPLKKKPMIKGKDIVNKNRLDTKYIKWKGMREYESVVCGDYLGGVFEYGGEIFRAIYSNRIQFVKGLFKAGLVDRLVQQGLIVETRMTDFQVEGYGLVLWHRSIPFWTRPEEWNPEFMKDAALCGIDLNLELLQHGLGCVDFHPWNIQQKENCSPVWTDFGSILSLEHLKSIGLHDFAVSELLKYFVRPLLMMSQKKNLRRICRLAMLDQMGISGDEFQDLIKYTLPFEIQDRKTAFEKLRELVAGLEFPRLSTYWMDYHSAASATNSSSTSGKMNRHHIDSQAMDIRSSVIRQVVEEVRPKKMVDLSCNSGEFSIMAAKMGVDVYAVDKDEGAIDILYHRVKNDAGNIPITFAIRDLSHEQKGNIIQGDLAIAPALSHHFRLRSPYLPFSYIAKVFSSYTTKTLLTDFMPNGLGGTAISPNPLPADYNLDSYINSFEKYFKKIEVIYYPISSSYRIFVFCTEKKTDNEQRETLKYKSISSVSFDNDKRITVICSICGKRIDISRMGLWTCPHCGCNSHFGEFPDKRMH